MDGIADAVCFLAISLLDQMRRNAKKELLCGLHLRVSPTLPAITSFEHNPDTFLQHSFVVKESHYVLRETFQK